MTTAIEPKQNIILDFGANRKIQGDVRQVRIDAAGFIHQRYARKSRLMSQIIILTIEEGLALEFVFQSFNGDDGTWSEWVSEFTPYDPDTVKNYRNLAANFRVLVEGCPDSILDKMKLRALYKLGVRTVTSDSRSWFFERMILEGGEIKGDERLAVIAKDADIRNRLDAKELTIEQALGLAVILADTDLNPFINELSRELKVQFGGVIQFLNHHYQSYLRTNDEQRPEKTWMDIVNNDYHLVWDDRNGEHKKHLSDCSAADCTLYINTRIQSKFTPEETTRATATISRTEDGKIVLELMDKTIFHPDLIQGEIIIDLILDSLEDKS